MSPTSFTASTSSADSGSGEALPGERATFLDGLRGVAAIAIVFYHFTQHTDLRLMTNAYVAVDLFFVLSGYVMTRAYASRIAAGMNLSQFMALRLIRLYPMFFVGLSLGVVALCVKHLLGQTSLSFGAIGSSFLINAVYLPYLNDETIRIGVHSVAGIAFPGNHAAWTLFFELVVNLIFYTLWRCGLRSGLLLASIIAASATFFLMMIVNGSGGAGWGTSVQHLVIGLSRTLCGFSIGVLLAELKQPPVRTSATTPLAFAMMGAFLVICALPDTQVNFLVAILASPLIVRAGAQLRLGGITKRICIRLGTLSYPIYCLHFPILLLADAAGILHEPRLGPIPVIAWVLVCCLLAHLAAKHIDVPARAWMMRRLAARNAVSVPLTKM
ncbi:MAG: acyltransferase [Neorhizobium sp.]|nr:acyltransferase [Neorhizobium sp.]